MQKLAVAWAYLAGICHGRRLHFQTQRQRSSSFAGDQEPPLSIESRTYSNSAPLKQPRSSKRILAKRMHQELAALETFINACKPAAAFRTGSSRTSLSTAKRRIASSHGPGASIPVDYPCMRRIRQLQPVHMSDTEEASDEDQIDWREMRARLVAQEKAEQKEADVKEGKDSNSGFMFVSPLIEQGSVLLSGVKDSDHFALRQQYFHKNVIFILEHDDFEGTKGIILNRPTAHEIDGWRVWYGGPCAEGGMFLRNRPYDHTTILCLHTLEDLNSTSVMKGVAYTSLENAKALISKGVAKQSDFWLFVGVAGWAPQQLQGELDRQTWYLASADSGTLVKELLRQGTELPPPSSGILPGDGLVTWETLMQKIGLSDEVNRTSGSLADRMLSEWCRFRLVPQEAEQTSNFEIWNPTGMVLRSGLCSDRTLLDDQFLHKSLILVLGEVREDDLVAVVLNRPIKAAVQLTAVSSDARRQISFGGFTQVVGGGGGFGIDQTGLLWLGQTAKLEPLDLGVDVGDSGLRRVPSHEAYNSIKEGATELSDFLIVTGLSVFTRDELDTMLQKEEFTVIDDARPFWPQLFELSNPRSEASEGDLNDGTSVWWAAGLLEKKGAAAKEAADRIFDGELPLVQPSELADEALEEWLKRMNEAGEA